MTKRIALAVEGQTELYFALWLIQGLAHDKALHIKAERIGGGTHKVALYKMAIEEVGDADEADVHVLVVDCSSDERVVSYIVEQHQSLVGSGYSTIIGLRDLRPDFSLDELERLKNGIAHTLGHLNPQPDVAVAVQELEAWFLAERTHFERLDGSLSAESILESIGVDISGNSEEVDAPAAALNSIYELVGLSYSKSRADVQRTIGALALERLEEFAPVTAPSAAAFIEQLRAAL